MINKQTPCVTYTYIVRGPGIIAVTVKAVGTMLAVELGLESERVNSSKTSQEVF